MPLLASSPAKMSNNSTHVSVHLQVAYRRRNRPESGLSNTSVPFKALARVLSISSSCMSPSAWSLSLSCVIPCANHQFLGCFWSGNLLHFMLEYA